jgi:hypothetical protein
VNDSTTRKRANTAFGAALIGMGALFLISRVFGIGLGRVVWPFFIIIPGLLFFAGMFAGGKSAGPLAIPGSIITVTGSILLYDSMFNAWANWAYIWALIFPTAVGIGLLIHGTWSENPAVIKTGSRWAAVGMLILLGMGSLFELLIYPLFNVDRGLLNTVLWPALLIGIGVWLMRRHHHTTDATASTDVPALTAYASEEESASEPVKKAAPPPKTVKKNGHGLASPVVGFEPLDPTRGKK